MYRLLLLSVLLGCAPGLFAADVLGLFQSIGRSQWVLAEVLLRALAERGHHITVVTTFPSRKTSSNWTEILIPNAFSRDGDHNYLENEMNTLEQLKMFTEAGKALCHDFLEADRVEALLKLGKKFDVIILEIAATECLLGYAHKMRAPIIVLSSFMGTEYMGYMVGNPNPVAYVPNPILPYTTHMSFLERLHNTLMGIMYYSIRQLVSLPALDAILRTHFNDSTFPSLSEIEKQVSLLIVNYHFSHGCPRPLVPNMVEVGGMHVRPPMELPQDLQKFLDEAENGAIYFSLGSNVKSSHLPEKTRSVFLEVFSKLKQRVLWKWEADSLPGQPPNVRTGKWLPQSDILAHKNVRVFITHGGLLSTQEATARGVPLVGIPVFADQALNMAQAQNQGYAVKLELSNVTEESLQWALREVLHSPRYRDNAQRLSRIYKDRPVAPLDEAVYWTEYVVRHQGAPHLRSAALDLAWYQYFLLDVVAALLAAAALPILVTAVGVRAGLRRLWGSKAEPKSQKRSKKTLKKD